MGHPAQGETLGKQARTPAAPKGRPETDLLRFELLRKMVSGYCDDFYIGSKPKQTPSI
jgi:hypothetical protein